MVTNHVFFTTWQGYDFCLNKIGIIASGQFCFLRRKRTLLTLILLKFQTDDLQDKRSFERIQFCEILALRITFKLSEETSLFASDGSMQHAFSVPQTTTVFILLRIQKLLRFHRFFRGLIHIYQLSHRNSPVFNAIHNLKLTDLIKRSPRRFNSRKS